MSSETERAGDETPGESPAAPTIRSPWRWLAAAIVIGLVGLGIRGWLHQQPYNSDDIQYFTLAKQVSVPSIAQVRYEGPQTGASPNSLRFLFIGVPAATTALLGDGADAYYAAIYLIAAFSLAGLLSLAWVLAGPRTAVIATAIWATSYAAIAVDTRLVPDNLGTGFALMGLALVAYAGGLGIRSGVHPPKSRWRLIACAATGGFLLWAAFATRASFFIFPLAGAVLALLGKKRWTVFAALVAGGVLGEIVELLYFAASSGDPFVRWRALLGFGSSMAGAKVGADSAYAGYTLGDLFTRYPRILWRTDSAEIFLHFAGLAVFVWWAVGWRDRGRLAKALCGFLAYGFLAFTITNTDPVVPLLREKIRYYATAAPFFYIAVAELMTLSVFRRIELPRFDRWVNGRPRRIAAGALVATAVVVNLAMASDSPQFAKNGNDGLLTAAEVLESDAEATGRPKVLYQDMRTSRVMSILLPAEDGWSRASGYDSYLGADFQIGPDGYLVLNWKRLNANVRRKFGHAPRTHNYYRIIEKHPLVARHRRGSELVDLFFISKREARRDIRLVSESFPRGWSRYGPSSRSWAPISSGEEAVFMDGGRYREYIYSGEGLPGRASETSRLPRKTFFQVRLVGRADHMTQVLAYLFWWRDGSDEVFQQYMGRVWVGPEPREYAMWTYLPEDARSHRMVLRADAGARVSRVTTHTLGLHPDDELRQFGGAWPVLEPNATLAAAARQIRADARAHQRPRTLYDELRADRVLELMPEDQGWTLAPRGDEGAASLGPRNSYLLLSWDHLRDAAHSDFEEARIHRYYRGIEDHLVVYRHRDDQGFHDVFFAPPAPIERRILAEDRSFPQGWTRLLNSTKTWKPVEAGPEIRFTSQDADDEYIYSSGGPVWRATVESTALEGERFVEVVLDAEAPELTDLRAALFWWPEGSKEPRRQSMGRALAGPSRKQLAFWTYLPARATSHRVVFRSKAGVVVSNVRARVLERLPGDRVEQHGGAW